MVLLKGENVLNDMGTYHWANKFKSENVPASQSLHAKHCSRPLSPSWKVPSVQDKHDVLLNPVQCLLTYIPVGTKTIDYVGKTKIQTKQHSKWEIFEPAN